MTLYLLDANVLREFGPKGHRNVKAWLATVDDSALRISVISLLEMRRGWEARKKQDLLQATQGLARLDALQAAFKDRTIPVDAPIVIDAYSGDRDQPFRLIVITHSGDHDHVARRD